MVCSNFIYFFVYNQAVPDPPSGHVIYAGRRGGSVAGRRGGVKRLVLRVVGGGSGIHAGLRAGGHGFPRLFGRRIVGTMLRIEGGAAGGIVHRASCCGETGARCIVAKL